MDFSEAANKSWLGFVETNANGVGWQLASVRNIKQRPLLNLMETLVGGKKQFDSPSSVRTRIKLFIISVCVNNHL